MILKISEIKCTNLAYSSVSMDLQKWIAYFNFSLKNKIVKWKFKKHDGLSFNLFAFSVCLCSIIENSWIDRLNFLAVHHPEKEHAYKKPPKFWNVRKAGR